MSARRFLTDAERVFVSSGVGEVVAALSRMSWDYPQRIILRASEHGLLLRALRAVLAADPAWALSNHAVAFATQEGLVYAQSAADLRSLSAKNTFILQKLEGQHPMFAEISRASESSAHSHVSISAYSSRIGSASIGAHQDLWDNVVIQLAGSKRFILKGTEVTLRAGDVLSIPYGVTHDVVTLEPSLHISVVLLRTGWEKDSRD